MGGLVKGGVALPVIICPTTTTEREEKRESNLGGSLLTVNKGEGYQRSIWLANS